MINTKATTVVEDVIGELCSVIGVDDENEKEEFSLYCIVEGEPFTVPLTKDHYILDVTTGKLLFSRSLDAYIQKAQSALCRNNRLSSDNDLGLFTCGGVAAYLLLCFFCLAGLTAVELSG